MAMAWNSVLVWSVRGDQVCPPSVVRQMPPVSVAAYMTFGSDGSTAMPLRRPVDDGLPGAWPVAIGEGPMGVQVRPFRGIEMDGRSRASNISNPSRTRGGACVRAARRRTGSWRGRRKREGSQPRSCLLIVAYLEPSDDD